jgi:hypothetical protein
MSTAYTTGYEFARLWVGVLGVAIGLVAIGFGVWLLLRRRVPASPPVPVTGASPDPDLPPATVSVPMPFGPATPADPLAPPTRMGSRAAPIALLVVGALLTVAGLARTIPAVADDLTHHTVTLPETAGTLKRIQPTAPVQNAMNSMKSALGPELSITNVQTGVYAESGSGQPAAILLVAEIAGNPNPDDFYRGVAQGASQSGTALSLMPADTAGMPGDMRCSDVPVTGGTVGVCLWLDSDTVGMVFKVPGESQGSADVANTLRAAAEN